MNRTQILEKVAEAIKNRDCADVKTWRLCWEVDKIVCVNKHTKREGLIFFTSITSQEVVEGFTVTRWNFIEGKIVGFLIARGLL